MTLEATPALSVRIAAEFLDEERQHPPGECERQMAEAAEHNLAGTFEPARRLRRNEIIERTPNRDGGHAKRLLFRQFAQPSRSRLHLPRIAAEAEISEPGSMMRASKSYELFDTLAAMQLQVGARGEAPHAVSYEHELGGARFLEVRLHMAVQLTGKPIDASERRLKIDGLCLDPLRAKPGQEPTPQAAIAKIAMHEHDGDLPRPRLLCWGAEQRLEGLNDGEQCEIGEAFGGDCPASCEEAGLLAARDPGAPGPGNGEGGKD